MAIGQGSAGLLMDDIILYQLQLSKLKDLTKRENESDDSDSDIHQLFRKSDPENTEAQKKKEKSLSSIGNPEWVAMSVGIFFVTSLFTIASYQAYKENALDQLSHVNIVNDDIAKDAPHENTYNRIQLPLDVLPISYILYLYPQIKKQTYTGLIKISVSCKQETSQIVLHSSHHQIRSAVIKSNEDDKLIIKTLHHNKRKEMIILSLNQNLTVNHTYTLLFGIYNALSFDINNGIYLSEYTDGNGVKRTMMSTDFEPTNARRAFPCFDEPAMKATWSIIIQHEKNNYNAISNMPVSKTVNLVGGNIETFFESTPPMSSYLVVMVVTEYVRSDETSSKGVKIHAYSPRGREAETGVALTVAPLVVDFYSKKFGIDYMFPKLGLLPVTRFSAGADETWGMMLFEETQLLYDFTKSSVFSMVSIAQTISHEIAHQWFGDLVTMKWWNDLWLKESFASYLQTIPLQYFFPSWDLRTAFYDGTIDIALAYDASKYTHPIAAKQLDPTLLMNSYDEVTYEKGASVVAMLGRLLGDEKFFKGANIYLNRYNYSNANITQFWEAMSEAAHPIDVVTFMNPWITQPGFPLISINYTGDRFLISQEKYTYQNLNSTTQYNDSSLWHVAIAINICGNTTHYTLQSKEGNFSVTANCSSDEVYKANYGSSGFYRVNYDESNWLRLLRLMNMNHLSLHPIDRANVLADVYSLVSFNYLDITLALQFTEYLDREHNPVPWNKGITIMDRIRSVFYHTKLKKCVETYTLSKVSPVLTYLNSLKDHSHIQKKLINLMLSYAIRYNLVPIVTQMNNKFLKWIVSNGTERLPPNIRSLILSAGIRYNGVYEWEYLFQYYKRAYSVKEKDLLLNVLSLTKDRTLLKRLLNYSQDSTISDIESVKILNFICSNRHGRKTAWKVVKNKWPALYEKFKDDSGELKFVLNACLGGGSTNAELMDANEFMANATLGRYKVQVRRLIEENIERNIEFKRHEKVITHWFNAGGRKC